MSYSVPTTPGADWKRRFFAIWGGQAVSLFGSQLVQFALIWHITKTTNSGMALAIATMMGILPQAVLSPFIGALVDRHNRQRIMIAADSAGALATGALALVALGGGLEIWHIYALLLVRAICGAFHYSAMGASTVMLVPKEQLARVQGLNQALRGGMDIVSAPLGALLVGMLPLSGVMAIDVATALLGVVPLLLVTIPQPVRAASQAKTGYWQDMRAGLRYVLGWKGLLMLLGMTMTINLLLTPIGALLPLLVTRDFGGSAATLAWFNAAFAIGIIAGGVLLGAWGGFKSRILTAMVGLVSIGVTNVAVALVPGNQVVLAIVLLGLSGMTLPVTNGSFGAVLQSVIAPEMQGRVFALVMSLSTIMAPVGLLIAGPVSDVVGIRAWYLVGGGFCALMGLVGMFIPAVMALEQGSAATQPQEPPAAAPVV